ncbi:hypothetical protein [Roseateles sp.]|uniref:hypothetical protein n=1 Tax=Roseateles sp. TaxID=1971397 RepID=UPI0039E8D56C
MIEFDAGEDSYCAVHEVYYDANGRLRGYSVNPAVVMWTVDDEPGAPQRALEKIQRALSEPPINVKEFG